MYLSACDLRYQWQAPLIDKQMVFAAELAAIGRVPASMLTTSRCGYARRINASSIPHDLLILSKAPQDCLVDALPNTGLHLLAKATPARHAAAAPKFTRQLFPRYSSFENKQNARQDCTIVDPRSPTFRRATVSRKMSFYKRPKVVGKKCLGHGISPTVKTAVILCPGLQPCASASAPNRTYG